MTDLIPAIAYRNAQFLISAAKFKQCPDDSGAEVAFAGRSNAGKSSAINALTENKKMARTSKTPGRTQLIKFFTVGIQHRLVDLPGYGFAKVPIEMKNEWQRQIDEYLQYRESLRGIILLMDIRHPLQDFDRMILQWGKDANMPVHVLLTKADKLKFGAAKKALLETQRAINQHYDASIQLFSALKKQGLEELAAQLDAWLEINDSATDDAQE